MTEQLFAYVSYRDAREALDWLEAIGFVVLVRQDGPSETVQHAEVRLGDVIVLVSSFDDDYETPPLKQHSVGAGLYLYTSDVDAIYERAISAGGRSVLTPEDTDWGTRRARVLDPGGREWSFGNYLPGGSVEG